MTERNPTPECLSHLVADQAREMAMRAIDHAEEAIDRLMEAVKPQPLRICRDCKWCRYPGVANSVCLHDEAIKSSVNVVTGGTGDSVLYCLNMRLAMGAPCGVEARLFEAREP